jgi:hypothetical protein
MTRGAVLEVGGERVRHLFFSRNSGHSSCFLDGFEEDGKRLSLSLSLKKKAVAIFARLWQKRSLAIGRDVRCRLGPRERIGLLSVGFVARCLFFFGPGALQALNS